MAHDWDYSIQPAPGTEYFKYFGCHDLRKCKKCGALQSKWADYLWGRITGYYWEPKVGRCPHDKKSDQNGKN